MHDSIGFDMAYTLYKRKAFSISPTTKASLERTIHQSGVYLLLLSHLESASIMRAKSVNQPGSRFSRESFSGLFRMPQVPPYLQNDHISFQIVKFYDNSAFFLFKTSHAVGSENNRPIQKKKQRMNPNR